VYPSIKKRVMGSRMKKTIITVMSIVLVLGAAYRGLSYRPTADQILQTTVTLNRNLTSLKVLVKTTIFNDLHDEDTIEIPEEIYIKEGGLFRSQRHFSEGEDIVIQNGRKSLAVVRHEADIDDRRIDTVFPLVFCQTSVENLLDNLSFLGVDTSVVTFDRIDKAVTFVIGNRTEKMPGSHVWIDKKRGFPLRFVGHITSGGKLKVLRAEYMGYTRVKKRFWLPTRIEYYRNDTLWIVCTLEDAFPNDALSEGLFEVSSDLNPYRPLMNFLNVKE
jgi:outer membrane lipoprotein-sorting protein